MLVRWIEEFGDKLSNERELEALHVSSSFDLNQIKRNFNSYKNI